ncbi:MAG: nitrilase-related carbon-nitrogen hydrolase, partial [Eubacteriales bacterium]|nr:nitrilase-related carbon-nitrogen hydrolase [Eubacteriales bacterium]
PLLARLGDQAKALGVDLLAGFMERDGDMLYLTHSLFRADGARFDYRKTHLGENEGRVFAAGDRLRVFPLSCGLLCGLELCVETHFPEITQTLSLMGAQVVFAPHAVPGAPEKRRALWQTYIPARAYDNRVYVACCNHADGGRFGGGCCAADPRGGVVAECYAPQPALTVFDADPALINSFRSGSGDIRLRYYPARRRPELYTLP